MSISCSFTNTQTNFSLFLDVQNELQWKPETNEQRRAFEKNATLLKQEKTLRDKNRSVRIYKSAQTTVAHLKVDI